MKQDIVNQYREVISLAGKETMLSLCDLNDLNCIQANSHNMLEQLDRILPDCNVSGLYALWVGEEVVYIGKTQCLRSRLRDHVAREKGYATTNHSKSKDMHKAIEAGHKAGYTYTKVPLEMIAAVEDWLIKELDPKLNNRNG